MDRVYMLFIPHTLRKNYVVFQMKSALKIGSI